MPRHSTERPDGLAQQIPCTLSGSPVPQAALISSENLGDGRIAVVYEHGEQPPHITIEQTAGQVQTILADGVAVAVVARAQGPRVSVDDVVLVERYS